MIDSHCHILPWVDDGAKDLEEAMEMARQAYEDGIRGMIATPHQNHPIDFKPELEPEEAYGLLKQELEKEKIKIRLELAKELYIGPDYLESLDQDLKNNHQKGNYIMIEFDRSMSLSNLEAVLHEISVRGYRPILAHVEMYNCLLNQVDCFPSLKNQGAYIQITASSLEGKRGKEKERFTRSLLERGLVDFVVTDAHGSKRRRPLLEKAQQISQDLIGSSRTQQIFHQNPLALMEGQEIKVEKQELGRSVREKTKNKGRKKGLILSLASIISLFLLGAGLGLGHESSDQKPAASSKDPLGQTQETSEKTSGKSSNDPSEGEQGPLSGQSGNVEGPALDLDFDSAKQIEGDPSEVLALSSQADENTGKQSKGQAIEDRYYQRLKGLESSYTGRLDDLAGKVKYAKNNIKEEAKRTETINQYLDEIYVTEKECDNEVYALLYDMQNELEEAKAEVEKVEVFRSEYNSRKAERESQYIEKIRS